MNDEHGQPIRSLVQRFLPSQRAQHTSQRWLGNPGAAEKPTYAVCVGGGDFEVRTATSLSHAEGWGTHSFSVARRRQLGRDDGRSAAVRDDDDGGGSAQRDTTRTATRVGRTTPPRANGVHVLTSML